MADYAEKNAAFIFYVFEKQWGEFNYQQVTEANKTQVGSQDRGLYLFYLCHKVTKKRYPVYIGYTGRSFHERFYQHARENGVIDKVLRLQTFGNSYDLFVYTHSLSPVTAKVVESIFLSAFDFALNKAENGDEHQLDLSHEFSEGDSHEDFKIAYQNIMGELTHDVPLSLHGLELQK